MTRPTKLFPDGYNGHTIALYTDRILEVDGNLVKLQCAEPGKEYMSKWIRKADICEHENVEIQLGNIGVEIAELTICEDCKKIIKHITIESNFKKEW